MATPHISAPMGAFAKTVLMPGDPLRAKFIADNFLTDAQLVTSVRNILGYTGLYKGERVSVMASGMGIPSIGIYSYELYAEYGVENIIRIGSAGSYAERLKVMDIVLAQGAYSDSTYAMRMSGCTDNTLLPSPVINEMIKQKSEEQGIMVKPCIIHSSDAFYSQESWQDIVKRTGTECVEMESFGLFENANVLGKHAACLLTISDSFVTGENLSSEQRQTSFRSMMKLALETAIAL